jgi:hypothetical protein
VKSERTKTSRVFLKVGVTSRDAWRAGNRRLRLVHHAGGWGVAELVAALCAVRSHLLCKCAESPRPAGERVRSVRPTA